MITPIKIRDEFVFENQNFGQKMIEVLTEVFIEKGCERILIDICLCS